MKVENGQLRTSAVLATTPPTHGVYNQAMWEVNGSAANALSQHWDFDSAVNAAARLEMLGGKCTVVCYTEKPSPSGGGEGER